MNNNIIIIIVGIFNTSEHWYNRYSTNGLYNIVKVTSGYTVTKHTISVSFRAKAS